jgi:hypothetical protein
MPDLCPGVFSAHDHAEGEFFSVPNENADNPGSLRRPGKEDGSLKGKARRGVASQAAPSTPAGLRGSKPATENRRWR